MKKTLTRSMDFKKSKTKKETVPENSIKAAPKLAIEEVEVIPISTRRSLVGLMNRSMNDNQNQEGENKVELTSKIKVDRCSTIVSEDNLGYFLPDAL